MPRRNVLYTVIVALISLFIVAKTSFKEQIVRNVAKLIEQRSIEAPTETKLMQGALTGMADAVGDAPYTAYLPPQEQEEYLRDIDGQYAGVGMANFVKDAQSGEFYFVPVANSPAAKAGLKFGDRLVAVDGRNVAEMSMFDLFKSLRGKENSSVELTIRPQTHQQALAKLKNESNTSARESENVGQEEELVAKTIERELIQQDVVRGDRRDEDGNWLYTLQTEPQIGYVAVEQFTSSVAALVADALNQLEKDKVEKLVLDFRGNPGGSLVDAVGICNALLAAGSPIVETRDVNGVSNKYYARYNVQRRFKIAVLVDGASASASEIVAAALQDADVAVVVGERTYGKGTVQSIYEIPGKMGLLHMTTASFWRPSGRPIHRKHDATPEDEWGVSPDKGYDVPITSAQRFYANWARRIRGSEKEGAALNAAALALMTEQTNAIIQTLREGAPIERAEAAMQLGVDPESIEQKAETDAGSNSIESGSDERDETKTKDNADDSANPSQAPFRPEGGSPYFDPQLDRALEYLNGAD